MTDFDFVIPPTIETINDPFLRRHGVELSLLRLDKIHHLIRGNKWFKLKLNLQAAQAAGHYSVLSFGGAYSNHLYALAAASASFGLTSIGIVRGELTNPLNPILEFARQQGMLLYPVSRTDYSLKNTPAFEASLRERFGNFYLIPEGGSNELGVKGCEEIIEFLLPAIAAARESQRCFISVACGTGATLAGLIRAASRQQLGVNLLGVAVLKGADFLAKDVASWMLADEFAPFRPNWRMETGYHFGGYARHAPELLDFIHGFRAISGIPIEPVYTGKLLFALYDLIRAGEFPVGSQIFALHTGGVYQQPGIIVFNEHIKQ